MALDQILHEVIALAVWRLAHEDEIQTAMPMLGELFNMVWNGRAGPTLGQHAVLIRLIDNTHRTIRK